MTERDGIRQQLIGPHGGGGGSPNAVLKSADRKVGRVFSYVLLPTSVLLGAIGGYMWRAARHETQHSSKDKHNGQLLTGLAAVIFIMSIFICYKTRGAQSTPPAAPPMQSP